ncbi:radical SAM family heme chaperone HemW [Gemmobacter denitrificans]|uniref:Heme chaperone HemW n=1 Tax=Gemmobacter denitrificans TaxID=3123040 RepID=A0ABU8BX62_9RHOB
MKHPGGRAEDWTEGGFGLYVHWPFCQSKCPYCDFNSHVAARNDQDAWKTAYLTEIARVAHLTQGRRLQTIYFGGGTPSLMEPATVEAIIAAALTSWPGTNDPEITLEANPGSVETARFTAYRSAGVNRVSLGLQALNDSDLRRLGRTHDARQGLRALDIALSVFDRASFDLIYARQDQSLKDWQTELKLAIDLGASHMSLYQLTIEPGTVFNERHQRGQLKGLPDDELAADFYDLTNAMMEDAGLPAYEISNHSRAGQESRHNQIYWQAGDYAGIGPGAHGRLTLQGIRNSTVAERQPDRWLAAALSPAGVKDLDGVLSDEDRAIEYLLMGLRLRDGIDIARLERMMGRKFPAEPLQELVGLGMVSLSENRLQVTKQGRPLLNAVLRKLTEAL